MPPTLAFPLHKGMGLISLFFNASSCVKPGAYRIMGMETSTMQLFS
jgi:hypothetical protein